MQYPNHIKKTNHKIINYANRGMDLEDCINDSNDYYLEINRALIRSYKFWYFYELIF